MRLASLRLQVLGLFVLPVVLIVLAVAVIATDVHRTAMRGLVAQRDERAVASAAAGLDQATATRFSTLDLAATALSGDSQLLSRLDRSPALEQAFPQGFAFIDRQGIRVGGQGSIGVTPESKKLIAGAGHGQVFITYEGENPLAVFVASHDGTTAAGQVLAEDLLRETAPALANPQNEASVYLVAPGSELLASIGGTVPSDLAHHAGVQAALQGEQGSSFLQMPDGEHVVAYAPITSTGWGLVAEEPWEKVTSAVLTLSLLAPFSLVPVLALALLGLWFVARRVIEPLRRLGEAAAELPGGSTDALEGEAGGIAEIQELRKKLVQMATRIQEAQAALRGYIGAITNTQEEERRRVAREIHDESIQHWIALDQRLQLCIKALVEQKNPQAERLRDLHQDVQTGIKELRRLSRGLRPIYLEDLGLVPAIEMLARDAEETIGIPFKTTVLGPPVRLPSDAELAVYRLVQEGLSNVARHADASIVDIKVVFQPRQLEVSVADDGQGFSPPGQIEQLAAAGHYGLIGMKERADALGGRLEIISAQPSGTTVYLSLPINPSDRNA